MVFFSAFASQWLRCGLQLFHSIWWGAKAGALWNSPVCPARDGRPYRPRSRPALWMWSQPAPGYNMLPLPPSERNKAHFLRHLDTRPGQTRRQPDWQLGFDFIVTTERDDIHCVNCPLHDWGSSAFPTSCQGRGAKLRMRQQAIWADFLCQNPLSLTNLPVPASQAHRTTQALPL